MPHLQGDDDPFKHLHIQRELVCEFMAVFSRLEYAIKATPGYAGGNERRAEALWDRFANHISDEFCAVPAEESGFWEAVNYLLDHPPRKQVLVDGALLFKEQIADREQTKAQQTLFMIRTVRNNLFHGGKHYPEGEQELGRNQQLVAHALYVLKLCLPMHKAVQDRYNY